MTRERRDVWVLSEENPWHGTIEWYARAVAAMQARDLRNFADPTSWRYQAEVHGTSIPRSSWPRGATWNECEHSTWYFLPWHRIYLHHFEKVVRSTIVSLHGPDDWALPYWNYSDSARPQTRSLPPAFRQRRMSSGEPNPLFVQQRAPTMNAQGRLSTFAVDIEDAFLETLFTEDPDVNQIAGFGGPATGRNHEGGPVGSLENVPHGAVHVGVGGTRPPGWMSRFETAARDPIFWLHHANIDRLWEAWLRSGSPRANPTLAAWRNQRFSIGSGAARTSMRVREVLDPTVPPLDYRYSDMPEPGGPDLLAAAPETTRAMEEGMAGRRPAELVGATDAPVHLGAETSAAEIAVSAPRSGAELLAGEQGQPERIYLRVENIRGSELPAPLYLVHLNAPDAVDPTGLEPYRVGKLSTFGIPESSRSDEEHSGSGLTFTFDITDVARRLEVAGEWDPHHLRVSFTPVADSAGDVYESDVNVGRISLYYG